MKYLIHHSGKGAIVEIPLGASSIEYGRNQEAFAALAARDVEYGADLIQLHEKTSSGVYYDWGLANINGAWFTVIKLPGMSEGEIKAAKGEIRRNHDVVCMDVLRIDQWIPFEWTHHDN